MKFEYNKHPANVYPLHSTFLPWKEKIVFSHVQIFFSFFYLKIQVYCWLQRVGPKWILIWQNFLAVKLQLISQLKSTQLNLNNLRDELGVDAIFTVPPTHH